MPGHSKAILLPPEVHYTRLHFQGFGICAFLDACPSKPKQDPERPSGISSDSNTDWRQTSHHVQKPAHDSIHPWGVTVSHRGGSRENTRPQFLLVLKPCHEGAPAAGTSGCLAEPAAGLAPCCSPWMCPKTKLPTDLGTPQCHTRGLLTPRFCGTRPACVPSEHALPEFPQSCFLPNIKGRNKIYMALPNWIPLRKEFQPICHTMAFFSPYSSAK